MLAGSACIACCNINDLPFVHGPAECVYVRHDSHNKWGLFSDSAGIDPLIKARNFTCEI